MAYFGRYTPYVAAAAAAAVMGLWNDIGNSDARPSSRCFGRDELLVYKVGHMMQLVYWCISSKPY